MDLDYGAWKFWLDFAQWLFTLALAVYLWLDRGRRDNRRDIQSIGRRQVDLDTRLQLLEEQLKRVPSHDDIARLREQYAGLESKLDRVTNTLDRIHDYLMNSKV